MSRQKIFDFSVQLFLFLSPLFFFRYYQLSLARGFFFIIGSFILFGISLAIEPKRKLSNLWLSAILLLGLLNVFFRENIGPSSEWFNFWFSCAGFIYVLAGVLLFHTVYCYADIKKINSYFKSILFVCVANLVLVIAQIFNYDFMWTHTPSLCGFMETNSQLGQYSALALPIAGYIHPLFAIIPLFTLITAKSISPILACCIGTFIIFRKKVIALLTILFIVWALFNIDYVQSKFTCRPIMWKQTLKIALQKPYLGWGYRSFQEKVTQIKAKGSIGGAEYSRAHNDYLHTAQELGFPILICAIMFLLRLYDKFKRAVKDKLTLCLTGSVAIVLINMSGQTLIRYASIAGTFIVLLALLSIKIGGYNADTETS